jgi:hypothetical protein
MLFKIQHWPGAGKLIMIALPFPYVVFLPVFLAVTSRNKSFSINNTVFVLFLLSGISVFSLLLALNVSKEKIDDSLNLSRNYNRMELALDRIPLHAGNSAPIKEIDNLLGIIDDYQSRIFAAEGSRRVTGTAIRGAIRDSSQQMWYPARWFPEVKISPAMQGFRQG